MVHSRASDKGRKKPAKGRVFLFFNPFRKKDSPAFKVNWYGGGRSVEPRLASVRPLAGDVVQRKGDHFEVSRRVADKAVLYVDGGGEAHVVHGRVPYEIEIPEGPPGPVEDRFWGVRLPVSQPPGKETFQVVLDRPFPEGPVPEREIEMVKDHWGLPDATPEAAPGEKEEYGRVYGEILGRFEGAEPGKAVQVGEGELRYDFRDRWTFTIDNETSKDLDDAVEVLPLGESRYLLGVHIADVAQFVRPGTKRDLDARERGTSHYLLDQVIHMLPECLAKDYCSLGENEDRLAMSVYAEMEISDEGGCEVRSVRMVPSVIRSRAKLTYEKVDEWLREGLPEGPLAEPLKHAGRLARAIHSQEDYNKNRGLAGNGEGEEDGFSHKLIEMFMITVNRLVGSRIADVVVSTSASPVGIGVYRAQPAPDEKDLVDYHERLVGSRLLAGSFSLESLREEASRILEEEERRRGELHEQEREALLRSLVFSLMHERVEDTLENRLKLYVLNRHGYRPGKAVRSGTLAGDYRRSHHHSLGISRYAWFTSPIRRYADVVNHRQIKSILSCGKTGSDGIDAQSLAKRIADAKFAQSALHRRMRLYRWLDEGLFDGGGPLKVRLSGFEWWNNRCLELRGWWGDDRLLIFRFGVAPPASKIKRHGLRLSVGALNLDVGEEVLVRLDDPKGSASPEVGVVWLDDVSRIEKTKEGGS